MAVSKTWNVWEWKIQLIPDKDVCQFCACYGTLKSCHCDINFKFQMLCYKDCDAKCAHSTNPNSSLTSFHHHLHQRQKCHTGFIWHSTCSSVHCWFLIVDPSWCRSFWQEIQSKIWQKQWIFWSSNDHGVLHEFHIAFRINACHFCHPFSKAQNCGTWYVTSIVSRYFNTNVYESTFWVSMGECAKKIHRTNWTEHVNQSWYLNWNNCSTPVCIKNPTSYTKCLLSFPTNTNRWSKLSVYRNTWQLFCFYSERVKHLY